jgi:hypothetical protein
MALTSPLAWDELSGVWELFEAFGAALVDVEGVCVCSIGEVMESSGSTL